MADDRTRDLLLSYKAWLFYEHRMVAGELAGYDIKLMHQIEDEFLLGTPGADYHFQWSREGSQGPAGWIDAPQPSTRAAIVLTAVGCPLTEGETDG